MERHFLQVIVFRGFGPRLRGATIADRHPGGRRFPEVTKIPEGHHRRPMVSKDTRRSSPMAEGLKRYPKVSPDARRSSLIPEGLGRCPKDSFDARRFLRRFKVASGLRLGEDRQIVHSNLWEMTPRPEYSANISRNRGYFGPNVM